MATELPKIIRSLEKVSTGYTVFEPNQVLSEKQLNGLTSYLDDQDRLTRIELLGVGIAGGLRVRLVDNKVRVGRGVGVSTDGDLLMLGTDSVFDRFKPYDESAPAYAPFYDKAGTKMIKLFELVREGESDITAQALTPTIPGKLTEMAVVMLMESYRKDKDLCSGTDCDNLGVDAINTTRVLLASAADAAPLLTRLATLGAAALQLPVLLADRPQVASAVGTPDGLFKLYRTSCGSIHKSLVDALPLLAKLLPEFTMDLFNADPAGAWITTLGTHKDFFSARGAGLQYYYDFLKDLVETWNALRETLAGDDTVLCPDLQAFPKHLLLGSLANPRELRTDFYPSPLTTSARPSYEHGRFLAAKVHVLINSFAPPADTNPVVTPSRTEAEPLEARAIPFYYAVKAEAPVHAAWSYRRTARGEERRNLGYRAAAYNGAANALKPLVLQLGAFDFFRIEGHQGQGADAMVKAIQAVIASANLPIAVRAVLLGTKREKIVVKPPLRYWDLHRLHHVLRADVVTRLEDVASFNDEFKRQIGEEVTAARVPDSTGARGKLAITMHTAVRDDISTAKAPLQAQKYSAYRNNLAQSPGSFLGAYSSVVGAAGDFKQSFGDMARTDFSTPFDSIVTSPHRAWIDWIDVLIDRKNDREDDRLLFDNFAKEHPGIEHFAGVRPGGTFVLVYGEDGKVVADFSLPYWAPEVVEDEPEEPALTFPKIRPDRSIKDGLRIQPPFEKRLFDFRKEIEPEWKKDISIQKDYFDIYKDIVTKKGSEVITTSPVATDPRFKSALLGVLVYDVETRSNHVEKLREIVSDPALPAAEREKVVKLLVEAQDKLATGITAVASHVVDAKLPITPTSEGGMAMAMLPRGLTSLSDGNARKRLGAEIQKVQSTTKVENPDAFRALDHVLKVGGLG